MKIPGQASLAARARGIELAASVPEAYKRASK